MSQHSCRARWPEETVVEAKRLRHDNLSYGEISKQLNIAKSTLHSWIHDIKRPIYVTEAQKREHLQRIRLLAVKVIKKQRQDRLDRISLKVKEEIARYSLLENKDYLSSLLSMLYWAEGAKTRGSLVFANTDPTLSLLYLTLLRKCYKIDESKLRVRLHLHYYHPIIKTRLFWSNLLNVPLNKFTKIYIKPRSKTRKFRKNFAGICFIVYHSEDLRFEVLERANQLGKVIAPVA